MLNDENNESMEIKIDLTINSFSNAQKFFANRKKLIEKEKKTKLAMDEALKNANKNAITEIRNKLQQSKKKRFMAGRKQRWYEKFYWFLTSENYLVISARDSQQNEILLKRYLAKQDVVFHAQIQGAAFTIVKNPHPDMLIPQTTLYEAACAAMAHSKAWETKVAVPVYWVNSHQVSKSAPTGLSLPSGSFMIYGKKNFIYPHKLEMGFGLLFKVDKESCARHEGERKVQENVVVRELIPESVKEEREETNNEIDDLINQKMGGVEATEVRLMEKKKKGQPHNKVGKDKDKDKEGGKKKKGKNKKDKSNNQEDISNKDNSTNKKSKKMNKKDKKKMQDYLDRYGDESKEEQELRLKMMGYQKNYKFEEEKKNFIWNKDNNDDSVELIEPIKTKNEKKLISIKEEDNKEEVTEDIKEEKSDYKKKSKAEYVEIDEKEDDQVQDDYNFEDLTAIPTGEDTLYEVMTICAPYMTLKDYRYKVKLVPGILKRGKILKMTIDSFKATKEVNEKEKELIKYIPEKEAVLQLLSLCKVQAQGISKTTNSKYNKKGKGGKKKKK